MLISYDVVQSTQINTLFLGALFGMSGNLALCMHSCTDMRRIPIVVDETTLVACGLCSLVQADACTVFLSKALCTSISMALYYRGAQGGPPLVDAEVSGRKIEPALVVPACK